MGRVELLAIPAELENGNYLVWEDRGLWLFAVRCPDEMVGGLPLEDDDLIGLGF